MNLPMIPYDGVSHHALGGGSYAFKDDYPQYLAKLLKGGPKVEINLIIQPNSSPHFGTLFSMALTFCLAHHLAKDGLQPTVVLDFWDNAKSEQAEIDGIIYQKGLRTTGKLFDNLADYYEILEYMKKRFNVDYRIRMEQDFLRDARMPDVVRAIIHDRDVLGGSLSPSTGQLAIRSACPVEGCGLVDKYGRNNVYDLGNDVVHFICPLHGPFSVELATQCDRLEFNCQLFNLVIGRFYETFDIGYIQICGGDYAGFWQEQLLWRHLHEPIIIVYTPLILDWSGSKLSKSLYLQKDAYAYLCEADMEYMLSYKAFKRQGKDLEVVCDEVDLWVREPFRLFRAYSVQYMHMLFTRKDEIKLGAIHVTDRVNKL